MMKPKYQSYEIVRIANTPSTISNKVAGLEGAILGANQDEQNGWSYGVHLYKLEEVWFFGEQELEATGRMDKYESFYDGTSITVTVDPHTGEGKING
jgi:hypothetical protein